MGKPNVITKQYVQNNARFAGVCNFYLFDGKQVIKPEDLVEKDVTELALLKGFEGVEAVEKVRNMLYDALNYTSQVEACTKCLM